MVWRTADYDLLAWIETMHKHLDLGTQLTLAVTLVFFVIALFEKGFTHDLLLEAGVFLVSVKLVIMSYKANLSIGALDSQLIAMKSSLQRIEQSLQSNSSPQRERS
jgi:hypothetical protein